VAFVCFWHSAVFGGPDLVAALLKGGTAHTQMAAWTMDARLVVVVCAVLTVWVAWLIGHRLGGLAGATAAGGLMAVLPLHVLNSHYATVDVPQTLFIAACVYFALDVARRGSWRDYVLAGATAGLAAGVKYNGAAVLVAPLVAHLLPLGAGHPGQENARTEPEGAEARSWLRVIGMLGAAGIAFAATCPYVILAWPEAWGHISFEIQHMRQGESPIRDVYPNGWLFHLHVSLLMAALAVLATRARARRALMPVAFFGLVWFAMIGAAGVRYTRYELPLEPVAAVMGGVVLARVWEGFKGARRTVCLSVLILWAAGLTLVAAMDGAAKTRCNVRDAMLERVLDSVGEGEELAVLWDPWFNIAPIDYCNGGAALRSSPLLARFCRPVRPIIVTSMDAAKLSDEAPRAVLVSDFELSGAYASVSERHRAVWELLWDSGRFGPPIRLEPRWAKLRWRHRPHWPALDSRYATPGLYLFIRADDDSGVGRPAATEGGEQRRAVTRRPRQDYSRSAKGE